MINCYVIDDEAHAVEILCDLIITTPGLALAGHSLDPLIGLDFITSVNSPELTFVDVNMPGLSGIELAAMANSHTRIVFTTAYAQFAVEAFEKEAFDYLMKPISRERFLNCITRYKKQSSKSVTDKDSDHFYVKGDVKGKIARINKKEIIYIEGALNYIIIHLTDSTKMITYLTMAEIQAYLPANEFSRIHKSFIVRDDKIQFVSGGEITLCNKYSLQIGNVYKDTFFEKLEKNTVKTKRLL